MRRQIEFECDDMRDIPPIRICQGILSCLPEEEALIKKNLNSAKMLTKIYKMQMTPQFRYCLKFGIPSKIKTVRKYLNIKRVANEYK